MAADEQKFMTQRFSVAAYFAILTVTLGGLVYGYNLAVISGALLHITTHFSLTPFLEGFVVSVLLLGACVGTVFVGPIVDRFGRKAAIILSGALFIAGGALCGNATLTWEFVWGRALSGIAIGIISVAAPLYLAEISPSQVRGKVVSLYQFLGVVGIFVGYLVNYLLGKQGDWRGMFDIVLIPAAFFSLAMFFCPETPEWLHAKKGDKAAERSFKRLRVNGSWHVSHIPVPKRGSWQDLFKPAAKFALLIGVMLNVFQQITGINGVIYFAPKIFETAGYDLATTASLATMGIGVINILSTFAAVQLVDRAGRKPLLQLSLLGMTAALIGLAVAFFCDCSLIGIIAIICLLAYVGSFAIGMGPVPWLIIAEIYPLSVRGRAMSIATFANWFFNFLIAQSFLGLITGLGSEGVFFLFAVLSLVALFFVTQFIPETKGKSLEEIEKSLAAVQSSNMRKKS